jgi:cytochrome oxidase Cu insertion factor (SCO1/SenC/PrrC family)
MKNIYKALLIIAVLCQHGVAYSQGKEMQPTFKGIITTNGRLNSMIDTIEVIFHKPYTPYRTNYETFTITTDKDGNFSFRLPNFKEPAIMSFWVMKNGRAITEMARKRYFFENTDKVYLNIDKNTSGISVIFNGNGADKYKLIDELVKLGSPAEINTEFRSETKQLKLSKSDSLEIKLDRFIKLTSQLVEKKKNAIIHSNLSNRMKTLVNLEYAPIFSDWKFRMVGLYSITYKNEPNSRLLIKEKFNLYKDKFKNEHGDDLALCPSRLNFLAREEAYDLLINSATDSIKLKDLYIVLTSKYSGLVRERLVANLFLGFSGYISQMQFDNKTVEELMEDGRKYITIPFVKNIYSSQEKLAIGKLVYNASFKDLNGNSVSLTSLRNKVVFVDLWFTGCGACAKFHQDFHQDYYQMLKGKEDFVYLSISVDSNTDKWKKGLETGMYTSKEYLNVYAENGFNHPFPKHYNLSGAPFLLILNKKGEIYANTINGVKDAYGLILNALKGI